MAEQFDGNWRPPHASDLGGPEQLADVTIDFRHWHASKGLHANGEISDVNLRKLIKLAYFASQTPEEGRYPQFRLFSPTVSARSAIDEIRILKFQDCPVLKDVNSLRRLAPSVASHDRGLWVTEENGQLICQGIVSVARPKNLGPPQQALSFRPDGLMVRVDGPGALQVTEAGLSFVLRAGNVQNLTSFHLIDPIKNWFRELADTLVVRCSQCVAGDERSYLASHTPLRMLVRSLWSDVLMATLNMRHGGAFVILSDIQQAPLTTRNSVLEFNLGDDLQAYWSSRLKLESMSAEPDYEQALQTCHGAWQHLLTRTKALAQLSAVDGCVLLDRELRVDSFGGMIHVETATDGPELDYWSREVIKGDDGFGTRHRSARDLCQSVRGAMAFVVSQDGELTLYVSDADHLYRAGPLSPADGSDW